MKYSKKIYMLNIEQKLHRTNKKKMFSGKNLVLLPKIFATIFTNPKYTGASLDIIILLASNGIHDHTMRLLKTMHPSYVKSTVVPFLATLKIKDAEAETPIFDHITYNNGLASISYKFSSSIKEEFAKIHPKELKNGTFKKGEGYIIVNVDEFLSLKGLYTKQLYLSLCAWQKGQNLDIYRTGEKSLFKLWQLPKSYEQCLVSKILKPAIDKINALTSLHIVTIACYESKFSIIYKRLKKKEKSTQQLNVIIDRHPHIPKSAPPYRSTLFVHRTPWQAKNKPKKVPIAPKYTAQKYYNRLIEEGVSMDIANNITQKKKPGFFHA